VRAAINAIWKSVKSRPGWRAAYCGAQGCGKRLAQAYNEGGRTGPGRKGRSEDDWQRFLAPGFVRGPDGYWRRSQRFRDHHPMRSRRRKHLRGQMDGEGHDVLSVFTDGVDTVPGPGPDRERPTETYYLPGAAFAESGTGRKSSVALKAGEVAYVICPDPKCQQLNEIR